jgi:hypothetical protein
MLNLSQISTKLIGGNFGATLEAIRTVSLYKTIYNRSTNILSGDLSIFGYSETSPKSAL